MIHYNIYSNKHIGLGTILRMAFFMLCSSFFTSCDDDPHEGERGLAITLGWQDEADKGTPIDDLRLWVYRADGEPLDEYHYDDARDITARLYGIPARDIAARLYEYPAGDYVLVAAANVVAPLAVEEAIGNGVKPYEGLTFALADASASPAHAHYGVTEVSVRGSGVEQITLLLRRVLSELTVTIEGVPDGASLAATVTNAATGVLPAQKEAEGDYGVATGRTTTVQLPETASQDATIATETVRLMPTATGYVRSYLHFRLTLADGTVREFDADAPPMRPAGRYEVRLAYADMKPYMHLATVSINDWTEGWVISGDVLNPDNESK